MTESQDEFDFTFTIDGQEIPAKQGDTILTAALRAGESIPHYCWHPGLSIAGNCRMCLVHATKAGPPGKPVIACQVPAVEGMEVESNGPRTKAVREGVMEFLLINHPLDCPVCDQAGECDLQQYSYDHGREESSFVEAKTQRPRKDLGPMIRFAGNRCIVCTRCVRFCDEVAGTGELSVVQRGDASYIDTFPGIELDNPLSGCTGDICPVGALLQTDWIHTTRTWLLRGSKTVCGGCSTGCNINAETFDNQVKRISPRQNHATNLWWMCDQGRLSHHDAMLPTRLLTPEVKGEASSHADALEAAKGLLPSGAGVAVLTTGFATNEELHLLKTLAGQGPVGVVYAPDGREWTSKDGFVMSADKNLNREGARRLLGTEEGALEAVKSQLEAGQVKLLIVHDSVPGPEGAPWGDDLLALMAKAGARVVVSSHDGQHGGGATVGADVAFPGQHWLEKDGSAVNGNGRAQRLRAAVQMEGDRRADLEVFQELARALGRAPRVLSAAGVFRRLVQANPGAFGEVSYNDMGDMGTPLPGATDTLSAEDAKHYYAAGPVSRGPGRANDEQVRVSVHRESAVGFGTARGDR